MSQAAAGAFEAADLIKQVSTETTDPKDISLESLALLLNANRLNFLENKITTEFTELRKRQNDVSTLHQVLKLFNKNTDSKGAVDLGQDSKAIELLQNVKSLGIELDPNKTTYTKEERDQAIDNIRMTIEDFNVLNDMQLQTITRLTNERYESYQLARAILKPLHDDKINKARAVGGR